jgi:hypothetical protein
MYGPPLVSVAMITYKPSRSNHGSPLPCNATPYEILQSRSRPLATYWQFGMFLLAAVSIL